MSKLSRHKLIGEIVTRNLVPSQEDLRRLLAKRGHAVTQATLSRDIHELGLVKTPEGYAFVEGQQDTRALPSVERLVREFVFEVNVAQNLVVLRTTAGSAQPVAAAIDAEDWPEIVGTVSGDDTIFIASPDSKQAERLVARIRELLA